MIFFCIDITIHSILYIFMKISIIFIFVLIVLVHFYMIMVRNGMLYKIKNKKSLGYHFLLCNRYCVYLLMKKKIDKIFTHLVMLYFKSMYFFGSHVVFNLTMN